MNELRFIIPTFKRITKQITYDNFYNKYMEGYNVLGVHIRTTDRKIDKEFTNSMIPLSYFLKSIV